MAKKCIVTVNVLHVVSSEHIQNVSVRSWHM